jgi:predicted nuclease of predicted toxin-antitoxin system
MQFLLDENVDRAVGGLIAAEHDVRYVTDSFGSGVSDPAIRSYLRSALKAGTILVTADRPFAQKCGQEGSRLPCLWLNGLGAQERDRFAELRDVVYREAALAGLRFFMEIRTKSFVVRR